MPSLDHDRTISSTPPTLSICVAVPLVVIVTSGQLSGCEPSRLTSTIVLSSASAAAMWERRLDHVVWLLPERKWRPAESGAVLLPQADSRAVREIKA